jgi:ring-1,2-phenylacetyl-CoA epoxidase subunit PaaD
MGIIAGVHIEGESVRVDVTPTFAGCPALDVIREDIRREVSSAGARHVDVRIVFNPPWTSERMTPEGRRKLKAFGLAPPTGRCAGSAIEQVPCPFCESTNTELESLFGPTLCRSIHYCHACRQSFEHFKPV